MSLPIAPFVPDSCPVRSATTHDRVPSGIDGVGVVVGFTVSVIHIAVNCISFGNNVLTAVAIGEAGVVMGDTAKVETGDVNGDCGAASCSLHAIKRSASKTITR